MIMPTHCSVSVVELKLVLLVVWRLSRDVGPHSAAIEDDYAKRLAKLSKQPLGKDEIG